MAAQPRRAEEGTAKTLQLGYKIGGNFTVQSHGTAPFLKARLELFEKMAAESAEKNKLRERPITITLPNGTEKEGTAFKTTPMEIAASISKSLAERVLIARVQYTEQVSEIAIVNADDEEVSEDEEQETCCGHLANAESDPMRNTVIWDCHRPLEGNCKIFLLDWTDKDAQKIFWHSSAHILGQALEREFGAHLTNGPALSPGFYYDAFVGDLNFGAEHIESLQKMCNNIIKENQKFERMIITKQEALELFAHNPFKQQIISTKVPDDAMTTVYRCGTFVDLCLGPHVPSTGKIKFLSLTKNSSAYFLGDNQNDTLQRVYGVSFPNKDLLTEYLTLLEEAKKRDHRLIGTNQELFFFESFMAPGSAFWLPKGATVYNKLCDFIRKEYRVRGFNEVITPNMFHCDLWKTSGHYQKYADCMYLLNIEGAEWGLKPMNCPGHCLMFKQMAPSYKQLPIRIADFGVLHRNEFSGTLSGLTRVRRFQQDDAHIFCRVDQVTEEVVKGLEFLFFVYEHFGFKYSLKLSTRPENRLGSDDLWDKAEASLKAALDATGKPYGYKHGDGAFYGPKIDIQVYDAMKRQHQCGTIQLDFQLPIRFDLQYRTAETVTADDATPAVDFKKLKKEKKAAMAEEIAAAGEEVAAKTSGHHDHAHIQSHVTTNFDASKEFVWVEKPLKPGFERPVIVHRAILGSLERMTAIMTEHFGGRWPFAISPRQAAVLPVSDKFSDYAEWVAEQLKRFGFDAQADNSNHTLKRKILDAQKQQWNYMLVVGAEEVESRSVTVRERENPENQYKMSVEDLIDMFEKKMKVHSIEWNKMTPFKPSTEVVEEKTQEAAAPAACCDHTH
eukprot:GDKK01062914.1.p1 GENE.GDKK01062914.1~~GDKK01062914.1.p1  ORF type:complete len:874 (+),score=325.82 GDKK01062914.1:99-2624(+)